MRVLIPARGGSKGIPNKNLVKINGKPLIYYTISEALKVFTKDNIYVSSDSNEILSFSESFGVNTIKRPKSISGDKSSSSDVIKHFINFLDQNKCNFDIVYLQPTSPLRSSSHINDAIQFYKNNECSSLVSVSESNEYPSKTYTLKDNYLEPLLGKNNYQEIRQDISPTYYPNGAIYIFNKESFLIEQRIPTNKVIPFMMSRVDSLDIDDNIDLQFARMILGKLNE